MIHIIHRHHHYLEGHVCNKGYITYKSLLKLAILFLLFISVIQAMCSSLICFLNYITLSIHLTVPTFFKNQRKNSNQFHII